MATSIQMAWIIADAAGIGHEAVLNVIRVLREEGRLPPSARGRGATPLSVAEAALLTLTCFATDLSKDAAGVADDLGELVLSSCEHRRSGDAASLSGSEDAASVSLARLPRLLGAVEEVLTSLARGRFFVAGPHPKSREYLKVELRSAFASGRYRVKQASIEAGCHDRYASRYVYVVEGEDGPPEHELWTRDPELFTSRARWRQETFGLRAVEHVARTCARAKGLDVEAHITDGPS